MEFRVIPELRPAQALALLAAATHPAEYQSLHAPQVLHQPRPIVIDPIVLIMPAKLAVERLPDFVDRLRQVMTQPFLQIGKFATQLLAGCFPL